MLVEKPKYVFSVCQDQNLIPQHDTPFPHIGTKYPNTVLRGPKGPLGTALLSVRALNLPSCLD